MDFLVEGSVRRENQRVRISAQLVRARDQIHVWAKSYERDLREILLLQREVAQDIAHEINVSVSPAASAQRSTVAALNPDAYEAYIKGRYFWNKRTKEDLQKAIEYFQSAIRDEPRTQLPTTGWRIPGSRWAGTVMCRRRKRSLKLTRRRERRSR